MRYQGECWCKYIFQGSSFDKSSNIENRPNNFDKIKGTRLNNLIIDKLFT